MCHDSLTVSVWNAILLWSHVPVAQLDRVSDSDSEGHRFESCRVHMCKKPCYRGFFIFFPEAVV